MFDLFEVFIYSLLCLLLPCTVLLIVSCRYGFYVNVNCWFCNTWTKVLYSQRNGFECPSCLQYNGFDKDGGYNKVISAQHDISHLKVTRATTPQSSTADNGLCNYCNNNQQLKIIQLANFVPLNEHNFDVEIEHFQKQLEKAYKLCKKCEKVLRSTIDKQSVSIFGDRLKYLRKHCGSLLDLSVSTGAITKRLKQPFLLNIARYTLVFFTIVLLCNTFKYNPFNSMKKLPYYVLMSDIYNFLLKQASNFDVFHKFRTQHNSLVPMILTGAVLQIVLLIWDSHTALLKLNRFLSWTILVLTTCVPFNLNYERYINALQVISALFQLHSLLLTGKSSWKHIKQGGKVKVGFQKLRKASDYYADLSDLDENEIDDDFSVASRGSRESANSKSTAIPPSTLMNTANYRLNESFTTARSGTTDAASVFNSSFKDHSNESLGFDLNKSLGNLHLGNFKPQPATLTQGFSVNASALRPKPILTPPKLKNITQNSWIAGGFWKNADGLILPMSQCSNLSRSSSQSSGFVSQQNEPVNFETQFSSLPNSRNNSLCGDLDRSSILSEPPYHFKPIINTLSNNTMLGFCVRNGAFKSSAQDLSKQQLYYKTENNMFYPVLNPNSMLYIQQGHNHVASQQFPVADNGFNKPFSMEYNFSKPASVCNKHVGFGKPVFGDSSFKVSGLFKNLTVVQPPQQSSSSFRCPQ